VLLAFQESLVLKVILVLRGFRVLKDHQDFKALPEHLELKG
jgi:hypothetical protein